MDDQKHLTTPAPRRVLRHETACHRYAAPAMMLRITSCFSLSGSRIVSGRMRMRAAGPYHHEA